MQLVNTLSPEKGGVNWENRIGEMSFPEGQQFAGVLEGQFSWIEVAHAVSAFGNNDQDLDEGETFLFVHRFNL